MTDKRERKSQIRRLQKVKTWQLVVLLVMAGFVTATFLRMDNVGMVQRRDAVLAADQAGDDAALTSRLYDLQRYAAGHMNADPGRIALEGKYKRDNEAHRAAYEASLGSGQGDIYKAALAICEPQAREGNWHWTDMRLTNCIMQELSKTPDGSIIAKEYKALPPEPYYHTFVSPLWLPSWSGWSVVVCGLIILVIIGRLVMIGILKLLLKWQYRRA